MYNYDDDFIKVSKKYHLTDEQMRTLYSIISEILNHDKWEFMKNCKHHLETRAIHSLRVCCTAWKRACKMRKCSERDAAIGGLLHDFFLYDWQIDKVDFKNLDLDRKVYGFKLHGFMHPLIAYNNVKKYFPHLINKKVEDIILRHMWPLTLKPPKYRESWLVCMEDKRCSLDVFTKPKELPKYLGISFKKDKYLKFKGN